MGTARGARFKLMTQLLESNGVNVWDARMQARKMLGIKGPYQRGYYFRERPQHYECNSPDSLPTVEERLDIDFWAIVSDLKAVLNGNLTPRPWAELSGVWANESPSNGYEHRSVDPYEKIRQNQIKSKSRARKEITRKKMVKLLMANGMNVIDAHIKALNLVNKTNEQTEEKTDEHPHCE